jgi:STE24 endopeptidase
MTPTTLSQCFTVAVAAETGIRLWLGGRQLKTVRSHRNSVPELFRGSITLQEQQRSVDYTVARVHLGRWATIYETAIKLSFTVGGGIALSDAFWRRHNLDEPWLGLTIIGSVFLLLQLAGLPFALLRTYNVEARFAFNRVSPVTFATDWIKRLGLNLLLGVPLALTALTLMQRGGALWWVWAWGAWLVWSTTMAWAAPRYIAPLFNRFTPLDDEAVKSRVEALLRRCGFSADGGVFVMDGSRRSAHSNAYFTGIGRTKRIVLLDTLLERISAEEIEAVMAHELGHFRLHHITQRLISSALLTLIGLAFLAKAAQLPIIYGAFGIEVASAETALLLFAMATPVMAFFVRPLLSWFSRRQEKAADDFAVRHIDPKLLSSALIKLFRDNASPLIPDYLHSAFFDSHPSALTRIERIQMPMSSIRRMRA